MKSSTLVTILGLLIAFLPYSGLGSLWEKFLTILFGLLVALIGVYVSNKKRIYKFLYELYEEKGSDVEKDILDTEFAKSASEKMKEFIKSKKGILKEQRASNKQKRANIKKMIEKKQD